MSDNVPPFEIQMEIIKNVTDVKALIRFRSVSKPWKSFIDSPEFIAFYGVQQSQPHRLLLRYKERRFPYEVKYVSFGAQQQQLDFAPNVSLLIKQLIYSQVIGSSCGLWCFRGYDSSKTEMLVMWNPSIRKSVGIVRPRFRSNYMKETLAFGVCPSTYDPTIVKMYPKGSLERKDRDKWQVEIFTLSSKTWKVIPTCNVLRELITIKSSKGVVLDRFIYWVAYVLELKNLILSFDLITHEFKEVNLPDSIAKMDVSISKFNESLVVSAYTYEVNGLVYGVWMMGKEGGGMTSFTKLFTINTPNDSVVMKVLGYNKSGEPIMEIKKKEEGFTEMKVYDPCSEHINDLGITGENGSFFICPYTETLLLTDHSDGSIIPYNY